MKKVRWRTGRRGPTGKVNKSVVSGEARGSHDRQRMFNCDGTAEDRGI